MNKCFFTVLICFVFIDLHAQSSIRGVVYDADTNTPLPGANVFIANTTKGTSTDAEGAFTITGLQPIPYELVISFLGYKTQATNIIAGEPVIYKVMLKPVAMQLSEIVVKGKKISKAKRKIFLRNFEQNFIGRSENAKQCRLVNPDVLILDEEGPVLTAVTADTALVLRNDGLGYRVKVYLEKYTYNSFRGALHFEAFMVFELLVPDGEKQKKQWAKNRLKAYYGSQMHFLRSLYERRANEEGYYFTQSSTIKTDTILKPRSELFRKQIAIRSIIDYKKLMDTVASTKEMPVLKFREPLEVCYIHEGESQDFQKYMNYQVKKSIQISYMTSKAPATILPDGRAYPVDAIQLSGYWSWELMAETLPLDYDPDKDVAIVNNK